MIILKTQLNYNCVDRERVNQTIYIFSKGETYEE